ncbi:hypothetical protein KKF34_12675 [Myxococcota bacterium]|nr:hypothetical protein [Myxococcota bacterium]MBU1382697.1 hypothetical protein [Myxococcota bacterium]MBU1497720.1 hypothetical protein [Myxococcota bacterium]
MAKAVQRVPGTERLNIFGVRHLSPASAYNLVAFLKKVKPKCVLIEGPSDATHLIEHLTKKGVKMPAAILSYTTESPVQTVLYPFAEYSAEYQAIRWAVKNNATVRFIDLPTSATVRLKDRWIATEGKDAEKQVEYHKTEAHFYADTVKLAGEKDYETFWERNYEHCLEMTAFMEKISAYSDTMRSCLESKQWESEKVEASYNMVRESFMKRCIADAVAEGYEESEIVAVVGAYHVSGLRSDLNPMSDDEIKSLPHNSVNITLMPYSYYRLSTQSGYGAGNLAPAYFEMMWQCINSGDLDRLAPLYLSSLGDITRREGNYNSTASVIEAVRLCHGLVSIAGGMYPALADLHDSAVCLLGEGSLETVAQAMARIDVGTAIGSLPEGVSQTPVQEDMARQIKSLKLEKYRSAVAQDLVLDLRENRTVKSREAAFIDLSRSIFFNRLQLLGINFSRYSHNSSSSSWSEKWILQWAPEVEIEIVEANLKGETIENAAAFVLKEKLDNAQMIGEVAGLMRTAFICRLLSEVPNGLMRLQTLCTEGTDFIQIASACYEISRIIQYRDVRAIDTTPLISVLSQLFLRACLVQFESAIVDDDNADSFISGMDSMHTVSQEQFEHIDDELWTAKVRELCDSDSRNAKVSGAAAALLMERNLINDADLGAEVSRRLSAGMPGDLAAMWFEGLCSRNRHVLLSRMSIWNQLDAYLDNLDTEDFRRSLVYLRRAFGTFSPREKNAIIDILADLWNLDAASVGEIISGELSEEEEKKLDELNDFDFEF